MQPLFTESNLVRDIVLGAEGTALKWKDKVFILVIDETGRSKRSWDWTSDFIWKTVESYSVVLGRQETWSDYILDILF